MSSSVRGKAPPVDPSVWEGGPPQERVVPPQWEAGLPFFLPSVASGEVGRDPYVLPFHLSSVVFGGAGRTPYLPRLPYRLFHPSFLGGGLQAGPPIRWEAGLPALSHTMQCATAVQVRAA